MKANRRNFLRNITLGTGAFVSGLPVFARQSKDNKFNGSLLNDANGIQQFNMCGYAAPKLEKVRIGIIGLGMRGPGAVERMSFMEGVEIKALCDKIPSRVASAQKILEKLNLTKAKEYTGDEGWKAMIESQDIDLVYICTPWKMHTPMALYAMKNGKHAATEVPAAVTEKECWSLVETSEKTKRHCMMLENCCYDFFELLTLNMARNGMFGELVHAEGAYIHDLRELNFKKMAMRTCGGFGKMQHGMAIYILPTVLDQLLNV